MNQEMEQVCVAGLATLEKDGDKAKNAKAIQECVEDAYRRIRERGKADGKVLVGVNQTIAVEVIFNAGYEEVLYVITLVGTVIDAEVVRQQQRLQQFDPRTAGKPTLVS